MSGLQQMSEVINHVAKREHIKNLPDQAKQSIITSSSGNLRKALLVFEAMRMQNPDFNGDLEVAKPDWETYCVKVADAILQEQSAQKLLEIRGKIYELLSHCIPPTVVLKVCRFPLASFIVPTSYSDAIWPVLIRRQSRTGSSIGWTSN